MNRRRAIAIVACTLWLFGVEALPNLHLGTHRDDHTHTVDGAIVHRGEHRHGDTVHSHTPDPKPTRRHLPQLAFDEVSFSHAAAGLGHRALALHQPAPSRLAPVAVDRPVLISQLAPHAVLHSIALDRPHARGPPA